MEKHAGSYDFSQMGLDSQELERLKQQAEVSSAKDREILLENGLKPHMKVLEIGCGPGFITKLIADLVPRGSVTGIDISEELLRYAKSQAKEQRISNVRFQKGDVYHLENLDDDFDFAYCRFVFQHLPKPVAAMKQIADRLKPGGILTVMDVDDQLLIMEPENETYSKIYRLQADFQKQMGGDRYVGRKLYGFLRQTGFEKINIQIKTGSSLEVGMKTFIDLTTGYKLLLLSDHKHGLTSEDIDEMYRACEDGAHCGVVGVITVSGYKK